MFLLTVVSACILALSLGKKSDWNQDMRDYMLQIHNDYRKGEGACQMNKLEYDMELEKHAQQWAEACNFKHEYKGRGENLAYNSNYEPERDLLKDSAKRWFDEKLMYRYGQQSCSRSCHYTQIVWDYTEKIGCYSTRCQPLLNANNDAWWVVCFYTPKGNWIGELPYKKTCDAPCHKGQTLVDGLCVGRAIIPCVDENKNCEIFAGNSQCDRNPNYMKKHCKKSCGICKENHKENGGEESEKESNKGGTGKIRREESENESNKGGKGKTRREKSENESNKGGKGKNRKEESETVSNKGGNGGVKTHNGRRNAKNDGKEEFKNRGRTSRGNTGCGVSGESGGSENVSCKDENDVCPFWAEKGFCESNGNVRAKYLPNPGYLSWTHPYVYQTIFLDYVW